MYHHKNKYGKSTVSTIFIAAGCDRRERKGSAHDPLLLLNVSCPSLQVSWIFQNTAGLEKSSSWNMDLWNIVYLNSLHLYILNVYHVRCCRVLFIVASSPGAITFIVPIVFNHVTLMCSLITVTWTISAWPKERNRGGLLKPLWPCSISHTGLLYN